MVNLKKRRSLKRIFINILCVFVPFKRVRKSIRSYCDKFDLKSLFFLFYKYRLYYFGFYDNFGDELAVDLMNFFNVSYCFVSPKNANILTIGSNLDCFKNVQNKSCKKLHIYGSGFMYPLEGNSNYFYRNAEVHAIRGELSKNQLETLLDTRFDNVVMGDPGLLIRKMFTYTKSPKYDVGIVCHMDDKNNPNLKNIKLSNLSYCFIDIQQQTNKFVQEIANCNFILSSSLHGLICSDSLLIPNRQIILSDKIGGGNYKFRDYYSVFSCKYPVPIDLRERIIYDDDIQELTETYSINSDEVKNICENLIRAFPKL